MAHQKLSPEAEKTMQELEKRGLVEALEGNKETPTKKVLLIRQVMRLAVGRVVVAGLIEIAAEFGITGAAFVEVADIVSRMSEAAVIAALEELAKDNDIDPDLIDIDDFDID